MPEHFNLPWQLAVNAGDFERAGIEIEYRDFPGGTGAMTQALRSKELDLAILLTEGAVADIVNGSGSRIVKVFVESALIWGIHVPATSDIVRVDQINGRRYAISRFGSGSHLMAIVDAAERGWPTESMKFERVENLQGAREALANGTADIFFWERFTTSPYVESNEFRRVGDRRTPWPAFVICVGADVLDDQVHAVRTVLEIVNNSCISLMANENACELIAQQYALPTNEVKKWLAQTRWSIDFKKPTAAIDQVIMYLSQVDIIDGQTASGKDIWFDLDQT